MTRTFLALFLLSACLSAQTETSLTVTSTLSISLPPPDQALLSITVTTPLNTGLDDVLTALASAGITASNLSTVSSQTNQTNTVILQWTFWLPVPLATLKTSLNALLALQQSLGQQNSAWTLTYYVQQVQSSAATPPCPTAELLSTRRLRRKNSCRHRRRFRSARFWRYRTEPESQWRSTPMESRRRWTFS